MTSKKLDILGEKLLNSRINNVLPHIRGRLLDIGCGTNTLVKKYGNGLGIDVYDFGGADIIVDDSSKLTFNDGDFDTVTIIAALNHIPNRIEVLLEVNRILKNNGLLIITMIPPGISKIWHFIRFPWDRDQHEREMKEGEVYGLSKKYLKNLVEKNGFILKKTTSFMLGVNTLYIFEKNNCKK
jgi:ubiquinone/menaquinone biosynthesis C-methylase UbiE